MTADTPLTTPDPASLRVESPDLHAQFQALCPSAPLPWTCEEGSERWWLWDADNRVVCYVDGNSDRIRQIVSMILCAVNTCGGFRAEAGSRVGDKAREVWECRTFMNCSQEA
jgi:hypothetical protein